MEASVRTAVVCLAVALVAAGVVGCGSSAPPPKVEGDTPERAISHHGGGGPSVESEIGGLNEEKVSATFQRAASKLQDCYNKGVERLPFLAGEVQFMVRVAKDGSARWAFVKDSNLGDHESEACMVRVLKAATWPRPEGGEGLAENAFTFQPSADERMPVDVDAAQLGAPFEKIKPDLSRCRSSANTGRGTN